MRHPVRSVLAGALAATLALSLGACSQTGGQAGGAGSGDEARDTFVYARSAAVTSFDLWTEITANNAFAIDKVFEPLLSFDKDGKIIDWLTKSHDVSADGLTYTFVLKDGLKFSDGSEVTADDVVFSINEHLNEKDAALPLDADIASVTAKDKTTVEVKLNAPDTPLLAEFANFSNGIVPKDFGGATEEEFFKNPVGTGPWTVEKWDPSGDLSFAANKHYWGKTSGAIKHLEYKFIEDGTQAVNQLKTGQVDGIENPASESLEELGADGAQTKVLSNGSWVTEQLFFNTKDEHFADVHVRRALALALDRDAVTKAVSFGHAVTANAVVPSAIRYSGQKTVKALAAGGADLNAAKKELAQSKYADGFATKILIPSGDNARKQTAQLFQSAAKELGIDVTIDAADSATFRDRFKKFDYAIMLNSSQADYPDADSIVSFLADPDGFSNSYWTGYSNPKVTAALKQARTVADGDERGKLYEDIQQTLADEVPYIPLYSPDIVKAVRSDVQGLEVLPNDSVRFQNVTFGDAAAK